MIRFADLHLHTDHSDGTRSARGVVDVAKSHGLEIIAISDHDNLAAFFEIKRYADESGVTLVPAVELSCAYARGDVHILAYAFDPFDDALERKLRHFREVRQRRGAMIVERLHALGIDISAARVDQLAAGGSVGRPHVARALVEAGHAASVADAFDRYLGTGKPAFVEKARFLVEDAVATVHDAGGLTAIAHPSLYPDHASVVPQLLDLGVDAVEVFHPDVPPEDCERYRNLARFRGKFVTGGSDDHGTVKAVQTLGTIRVPENLIGPILERL